MFVSRPARSPSRGDHQAFDAHWLRRGLRLLLACILVLGLAPLRVPSVAEAAGIIVTTTADTIDAGTCATVTLASLPGPDGQTSLREALCAAQTNPGPDTITFSVNGTFAITLTPGPDENSNATGDFDILSDVTITGNGSTNTIIDGQDLDRVFDIDPLGNCNAATSCTISLSEMTIRNGRAFASNFNVGGAIFIGSRATVSITNSVIESSASSTSTGGGIQAGGPALTLTGVTVQNNSALANGGGINGIGSLTINNSAFLNNQAEFGGGLALIQGATRTVNISNSTFSGNDAVTTALGSTDDGGAIYASTDTTITITGSTFAANTSANNGGGLFLQDSATAGTGTFNLTNNTISGNRADAAGGGIHVASGNATITNVTVTQNHSDNNNAGGEVGGGLRVAGGTVTLNNAIVAENFRGSGTTTGDNVSGTFSGSNNLTSGTPLLGPLASNGGSTQTHALLSGSPAINTGNDAVCPTTDQRGITRAGNGVCDIGAYEFSDLIPPDTTITATPPNPSASANATFTFTGSDTGGSGLAGFQCQIDGGGFSTCTSPRTYTGLADGSHTFQVRAVDGANNIDPTPASYTWIIDTTAPNTTITANPTNPSASTTAGFSFTGSDPGGTDVASFQCQLDGGGFSTCASPQTYTGLSQGSHTFQVRAVDGVGNVDPTPASYTWVVDTVVPDTTITANPTNPSASANASFSFTGSDPGGSGVASFQCQLDGGGFSTCTSPQTYTGLADGSHTFQVRAIDAAGNVDPTPASFTWVVDATGPDTTITANPINPTTSTTASFSFIGNDGSGTGVASFQCQLDGGGFSTCTSPQTYTGLADGSHTFQVRAVDMAGNVDPTPASFTWLVDTTGPDTTITATPPNPSASTTASFSFTGNDGSGSGVAGFECQLDGAGFTPCTSSQSYTGLSQGSHTFQVRAVDAVGNVDTTPASYTWVIDIVAPDTTITANPTDPSASANASFSFTGSDPGGSGVAGFECQLDGGAFIACASPQTYTGLSDGSHTFQVRAIDAAGNVDSTPDSFTFIVDTTEPDTTITSNPTNPSASTSAGFSFTGNDGGTEVVGFECQIDGGGFSTCASPQTYTGLSDGSHTFQVRAVDAVGNADTTPASFTWVIDTVAPDTTITANPTDPSASTNASFSFTGSDPGGSGVAGFECQLDGGGFSTCTSPQTYTGLSDGSHTFQVRAIDAANNVDSTPASFTWLIDTTAPTVAFSSAAPDPTNTSPIPVTVTFSESVSGFTAADITTSNGTVSNFAGSGATYTFDLVPAGQGLVTADIAAGVAQDAAGNGNTAATQFSRTYDTVAPAVTIDQAAGQADPTGVAPINFTVVFDEPVSGFGDNAADVTIAGTAGATTATVTGSGTTYNVAISGMTGTGTVVVTIPAGAAQDLATNSSAASTSTDNTVDFDPVVPVVTGIVRADPSPTSAASVQFTVTFAKNVTGVDAGDFNFTASGVIGANVTGVTGSGTTWTVTVSTGTGDGTLRLNLVDNDTIIDSAGNQLGGTGAGNGDFTTGQVYTIDKTAPSVASIVRASANPSNAASVVFTVTFSEIVSQVDAADFILTTSGVTGASVASVTGGGTTWTVTANTGSGDGSIRLDVVDDDSIVDVINNRLGGTGAGNGDFTTGQVYTIDKTAPTASNLVAPTATSGSATYTFTVRLTDNVAINNGSLDGNDIRVTGPGGFSQLATLVSVNPATNGTPRIATYQIVPPGGTWDAVDSGTYTVAVQSSQVSDTAGNTVAGSVLGSFQVSLVYRTYLPILIRSAQPDLVAKLSLSPNKQTFAAGEPVLVSVTVTNQGTAPATGFWVDLYINPATPPAAPNTTWNTSCTLQPCFGIAWYIEEPLAPGASIILSSANGSPGYTNWRGYFAAGTTDVYVYVDSWNPSVATGAVPESNEANNSDHIGGLTVTGPNPALRGTPATVLRERPAHLRR